MLAYYTIYLIILALGSISGAIRFRHLSTSARYFAVLIFVTTVVEYVSWYGLYLLKGNNMPVYRAFAIIQFALLTQAYSIELMAWRRLLRIGLLLFSAAYFTELILNYDVLMTLFPTNVKALGSVFIIGWALLYLREMLTKPVSYSFTEYPVFWLSIGWLLFSIVTLANFSLYNYLMTSAKELLPLFSYIRTTANIILYSLFIVAFFTKQRTLTN